MELFSWEWMAAWPAGGTACIRVYADTRPAPHIPANVTRAPVMWSARPKPGYRIVTWVVFETFPSTVTERVALPVPARDAGIWTST